MTTPDFRALCAELLQELCCHYRSWDLKEGHCSDALKRARAALAQPKPVWTEGICGDGAAILKDGVMQPIEDVIAALNAQPTPDVAPVATDEELYQLAYSMPLTTEQGRLRRCYNLGRQHGNVPV